MKLQTYDDPKRFLEKVQPFLERDEVLNSLILGVNIRVVEHPNWDEGITYQAAVEDEQEQIVLVASISPNHNLLVAGAAGVPQQALDLLVENLFQNAWAFPGVNGEEWLSERAAATWSNRTGQPYFLNMHLRAYELRQVIPPPNPPSGSLRVAQPQDLELVRAWREAFGRESLHAEPPPDLRESTLRMIEAGNMYLWDDGGLVSMAARTRPTPHGVSIGGVYTPPEKRGRGYASVCVAQLSQRMLDSGKQFCALFTDLDNPTSNAIYQRIGYRVVGDFADYGFEQG